MLGKTVSDRMVDTILYIILVLFGLATLFPVYYVVVMSITTLTEVIEKGGFVFFPQTITFEAYERILTSGRLPRSLGITVFLSTVGTFLNLLCTALLAYPLAKKEMPGRNFILFAVVFTMLFGGGMIPMYLLVSSLNLTDTLWSLILPGLVSAFNMLIMKTYFENLPSELEESAKIDGCGDIRTLVVIIIPLSMPIIATMGLFYGINHWNTYIHAIMFISDRSLMPIQVVLRGMIIAANASGELGIGYSAEMADVPPQSVKMAAIVVSIIPIIAVYPFLQRFFIKGLLLGSIKG
jgi:putative aldouronate transport system permease protein